MPKLAELIGLRRKPKIPQVDYDTKLKSRGLAADGSQVPDPTPLAPPVGYKKQPSMVEIVRDMVRSERLKHEAEASGHETFEESEDFDIGDDGDDLTSGYENDFDPPVREILSEVEKSKTPPPAPPEAPKAPSAGPSPEGAKPPEGPPAKP